MPGIYDDYKIALLDSSFFVSNFSEGVKKGLCNIKVYVADTFNSEIEQYKLVLSSKRQSIYDSNVRFLNENMRLNTLNLASFGAQSEKLHNDVWGLLTLLVGLNAKFVVITANQVLIQKIVLNGLKVDIYDLNVDGFIKYSSFPSFKSRYKFTEATWTTPPVDMKVGENSTLYCKDHSTVTLAKEIKTGLEANLYLVRGKSGSIAKIFKKDKLSANKFQNIKRLCGINTKLDIDWAIFPTEVLYYDANCTSPAGFIEAYVSTGDNLDDNPLFLGDPFNVTEEFLSKKQSYAVELCLKVVRQVCYLNTYGFYISDFNMGNFATIQNNDKNIQMWDTDSFGYESFFGKFFSPNYAESKNHPKYDTSTKEGAIDISNDALYQFVFSVLSLGDSPISEHTGKFKYDNPNYFAISKKKFFPQNIWRHLETVFRGEKDPSAEALMQQLIITGNQLRQNPVSDKTFKQLFVEVIPGYEEALKELEAERKAEREAEKQTTTGTGTQTSNTSAGSGWTPVTNSVKTQGTNTTTSTNNTSSTGGSSSSTSTSGTSGGTQKKSKLKIAIILLAILALIGAIGYYVSTIYAVGTTGYTPAPTKAVVAEPKDKSYFENIEYIGWSKSDAVADVHAAGWKVECIEDYSAADKIGYVMADYYNDESKTVTLTISKGASVGDDINMTGAKLSVNKTDITLQKGESIKLTVSASGDCPATYYFSWGAYPDVSGEWGEWITDNSAEITLTGTEASAGYCRFYIHDADTDECVGYTDIYMTIQ